MEREKTNSITELVKIVAREEIEKYVGNGLEGVLKDIFDERTARSIAERTLNACPIPPTGEKSALQERLEEAEKVIDEFADGLNWQSAGIYEGKPSEVLLWSGWMRGKSNGPHLARSYRAKYPKGGE